MLKYDFPTGLQSVLVDWDNEQLTDGECIDDILDIVLLSDKVLYNLIMQSIDCSKSSYMTDYEAIIYTMKYFERTTNEQTN